MCVRANGRCEAACQTEVCHLDGARGSVDENVLWLQIAVQDSVRVTELHCLQDLVHVRLHAGTAQKLVLCSINNASVNHA